MAVISLDRSLQRVLDAEMRNLETTADVLTYLKSPPSTVREATTEPVRKKQKKSEHAFPAPDEDKAILLARVGINLLLQRCQFPDQPTIGPTLPSPFSTHPSDESDQPDPPDIFNEVAVTVTDIRQNDDAHLVSLTNKNGSVHLFLNLHDDASIRAHLEEIVTLESMLLAQDSPLVWPRSVLKAHSGRLTLETNVYWATGRSILESGKQMILFERLLHKYLPLPNVSSATAWSPQDFYDNVHVPAADIKIPDYLSRNMLESKLYPFQQRALHWLLQREGAEFSGGSIITRPLIEAMGKHIPSSFSARVDANGKQCFVSHIQGVIVRDSWSLLDFDSGLRGGILAEEMGLGKTVELIALICLHKRRQHNSTSGHLLNSGATLIITPKHILHQWKAEIATHAPNLSVHHYKGFAPGGSQENSVEFLSSFDIVLTTYNVLSREIHYANTPPDRQLRRIQQHVRRRSPLVLINWWRVCLDEAQMVESGVGQAAQVARLIPRVNAWAVSGTPLRKGVEDLYGLLIFLQYEPYCSSRKLWSQVDKQTFNQIFGEIAMRHTKHKVAHELRLPPQKRSVITMSFTAIEEQNYNELFEQMCDEVGLQADGSPVEVDWDPNSERIIELMRYWLRRLRETCLHPQIGARNRKALGRGQAPLRTVGEVLEVMIEGNETELRAEERKVVQTQVFQAHVIANDKSNQKRSQEALEIYKDALAMAEAFVAECRDDLAAEIARATSNPELLRAAQGDESADEVDVDGKPIDLTGRLPTLKKQLRSALEVMHVCKFFVATSYFQMKESEVLNSKDSAEIARLEQLENENYDQAKLIRMEILQEGHKRASRVMRTIVSRSNSRREQGSLQLPKLPSMDDLGGIESRKLQDNMHDVSVVLNRQSSLIDEWRSRIIEFLSKPLVDEDQDGQAKTGDEYEDSTKLQDELYVYILALRTIVADRYQAVSGQRNLLMDNEVKWEINLAKQGKGPAPELLMKILGTRNVLKAKLEDRSLRGVVAELRSLHTQLEWQADGGSGRAKAELSLVVRLLKETQEITAAQIKMVGDLEKEQVLFRQGMNERLEFYRQLQAISDQVAPYKEELDMMLDAPALLAATRKEKAEKKKLAALKTKRRFLLHLRLESVHQKERRTCTVCLDTFENGVLTVCGHQYCKVCINEWWRTHRTCPECRRHLSLVDFHEITYKPQQLRAQEEALRYSASDSAGRSGDGSESSSPSSTTTSIYSSMNTMTMNGIKSIDLQGSYGTKIDTICRHILWLREHDPGAKSIIFSQYSDFLSVLSNALGANQIGRVSIRDANGVEKFRNDAARECFLLDAKSDSSGLNLVNATHVFLCEPLINAAIELQAIARVHRIGQFRETMVYMYLIEDTVEEAIYDISVGRRLMHMGNGVSGEAADAATGRAIQESESVKESVLDKANSLELQQKPVETLLAKGRRGGEIVGQGDLWGCLFGKKKCRDGNLTVPDALRSEVDRHLRAEAIEERLFGVNLTPGVGVTGH